MENQTWIEKTSQIIGLIQFAIKAYAWLSNRIGKCPGIMELSNGLRISSAKGNQQLIHSKFLEWEQCTIMLWVLVPPKQEGLRNGIKNSYILAHLTGNPTDSLQHNLFALRYSPSNRWEVVFTNDKGSETPESLRIADNLQKGWHHFLISWNHRKPEINFWVDEGKSGKNRSESYMAQWVENLDDNVIVGAWVPTKDDPHPYSESYCDTMIKDIWICKRFIGPTDIFLQMHRKLNPGS